jgi:hypothetical protein
MVSRIVDLVISRCLVREINLVLKTPLGKEIMLVFCKAGGELGNGSQLDLAKYVGTRGARDIIKIPIL